MCHMVLMSGTLDPPSNTTNVATSGDQRHSPNTFQHHQVLPQHVNVPQLSSADTATQVAKELIYALRNPAPGSPFPTLGNTQLAVLQ